MGGRPVRRRGVVPQPGPFGPIQWGVLVGGLDRLGPVPGLAALLQRLGIEEESPGLAAAALEFALEGLHLNRRLAKDSVGGRAVYGAR